MTVTELLLNFRQALLAVLPAVRKVNIPWNRPDAYDEWDEISSALFNVLVVEVLRWSLKHTLQDRFRMPQYDLLLETYDDLCVVEVSHVQLPQGRHVFHSFGTRESPFDVVELMPISEEGKPVKAKLALCPVKGARFRLRVNSAMGSDLIEKIVLETPS